MKHLALLGDSIIDNGLYTGGAPAVLEQVRLAMTSEWQVTQLAEDGHTTANIAGQLARLPQEVTHIVVSVGGNDALRCEPKLASPAGTVERGLVVLAQIRQEFLLNYETMARRLLASGKPALLCSIYDSIPGLRDELKAALCLFNDVIVRVAVKHGLPVLDLRCVFTAPTDYSAASPIEPSAEGGAKLAQRVAAIMTEHDFTLRRCVVYR